MLPATGQTVPVRDSAAGAGAAAAPGSGGGPLALAAGLLAGWTSAGSLGLLAQPLRLALVWFLLGAAIVALWPGRRAWLAQGWSTLITLAVAVAFLASPVPLVHPLAVAIALALLGRCHQGAPRGMMMVASLAVMILAVFRLACVALPGVWLAADHLAGYLARAATLITHRPLSLGASFAGVDLLPVMLVVYLAWLAGTPRPRWSRALLGLAAMVAVHVLYLVGLCYVDDLVRLLPPPPPPPPTAVDFPPTPDWAWSEAVRSLLPWNLPLLAALGQALIAWVMFAASSWTPPIVWNGMCEQGRPGRSAAPGDRTSPRSHRAAAADGPTPPTGEAVAEACMSRRPWSRAADFTAPVLALAAALLLGLTWVRPNLADKSIVLYTPAGLEWSKPQHEQYGAKSAGTFGMLPELIRSLGAQALTSPDLKADDLARADAVLVIGPTGRLPAETLQRLRAYVQQGGSLLLAAGAADGGSRGDDAAEILRGTRLAIADDRVAAAANHWQDCLEPTLHPVLAGLDDARLPLGPVGGTALHVHWSARPLLVGRWGWSTPEGWPANAAGRHYAPGDRLGDLVLAAEEPQGRGRVVVLGDASPLANAALPGSYRLVGRLLGYLAAGSVLPQVVWRLWASAAVLVLLVITLVWRPKLSRVATVVIVLGGGLWGCAALGDWMADVLPDGRRHTPNNLAYLDASHLNSHGGAGWADNGLSGLCLNFMRNGYLPLVLTELSGQRLERAALLVTIAPRRSYSDADRQTVRKFVEAGGTLLLTVGSEDVEPSRALLADFEFQILPSPMPLGDPTPEPEPLGSFLAPYLYAKGSQARALIHAGWEVHCRVDNAAVLIPSCPTEATYDPSRPVALSRPVGRGMVAVFGDSKFCWNKNLEQADGQPLRGMQANPQFWRWFLTRLTNQPEWIPPEPPLPPKEPTKEPGATSAADGSAPVAPPAMSPPPAPSAPAAVRHDEVLKLPPPAAKPSAAKPPAAKPPAAKSPVAKPQATTPSAGKAQAAKLPAATSAAKPAAAKPAAVAPPESEPVLRGMHRRGGPVAPAKAPASPDKPAAPDKEVP